MEPSIKANTKDLVSPKLYLERISIKINTRDGNILTISLFASKPWYRAKLKGLSEEILDDVFDNNK